VIEAKSRPTKNYARRMEQPKTQEQKVTAYMDRFMDPEDVADCLKDLAYNSSVGKLVLNAMDFAEEGLVERLQVLFQTRVCEWNEIVLKYCRGPVDLVVTAILEANAKIGTLSLIASTLKDCVGETLSKGLPSNVTLAKLMIWGTRLSRKNIYSIRQGLIGNTTLEELSFTNSHIEKDATGEFCSRLSNQTHNMAGLKRLDLFSCDLQDAVVAAIVKSLDGHPNLEHLELGKNQCSAASLVAVGTLLGSCKTTNLKYLSLALQDSSKNIPFFEISHMTGGLGLNSSLESFMVRGNQLSFNGMKSLVTCLSKNTTLEQLMMTDCELGNDSFEYFVTRLPDMKGLRRVWLNGFQSTGIAGRKKTMTALETALQTNVILEDIHLPFGYGDYGTKVDGLLDLNRGGRRLLQASNNEFSHTLWPLVLERVNRVHLPGSNSNKENRRANIMYSLLRGRVLLEV
jgi:hypothetical protein